MDPPPRSPRVPRRARGASSPPWARGRPTRSRPPARRPSRRTAAPPRRCGSDEGPTRPRRSTPWRGAVEGASKGTPDKRADQAACGGRSRDLRVPWETVLRDHKVLGKTKSAHFASREDQKCALCANLRTSRKMAQTEQRAQFCVGLIIFWFTANPTGEITAPALLSREDTLTAVPPRLTFYGPSSRNEQFTAPPPD